MKKIIMKGNGKYLFIKYNTSYNSYYYESDKMLLENVIPYRITSWEFDKLITHLKQNRFKIVNENLSENDWLDAVQENFKEGT